jgi:hypothetical protein
MAKDQLQELLLKLKDDTEFQGNSKVPLILMML